jgi:hypothetical protein
MFDTLPRVGFMAGDRSLAWLLTPLFGENKGNCEVVPVFLFN